MSTTISHTSLGAITKTVTVVGESLALPNESELRYRMEVDSGVVASGTDLASWTSSVGTKVFTPYNPDTNKVQVDSAVQLGGYPTIKLWPKQLTPPYYHNGLYGDTINYSGYSSADNRILPMAVVCKANSNNGSWEYYQMLNIYSYGGYHYASLMLHMPSEKIMIWATGETLSIDMPVGFNKTGWHVYVYSVNYVTKKISLYVDGVCLADNVSCSSMLWASAGYGITDVVGMTTPGAYNVGTEANFAAAMAWLPKVFTADDYADASAYLMAKYGLD